MFNSKGLNSCCLMFNKARPGHYLPILRSSIYPCHGCDCNEVVFLSIPLKFNLNGVKLFGSISEIFFFSIPISSIHEIDRLSIFGSAFLISIPYRVQLTPITRSPTFWSMSSFNSFEVRFCSEYIIVNKVIVNF